MFKLTLQRALGHEVVEGNEVAGGEAERTLGDNSSLSPTKNLPSILRSSFKKSKSAAKQETKAQVNLAALASFINSRRIAPDGETRTQHRNVASVEGRMVRLQLEKVCLRVASAFLWLAPESHRVWSQRLAARRWR